jgi:glycine betaine catabolism B
VRFNPPVAAPAEHLVAIERVVQETPTDRTFVLPVPKGAEAEFRFAPGQFVTVIDPDDSATPPRKKAYSISSSPEDAGRIEVTVRDMGDFGHRFYGFAPGKVLRVIPPRGKFTLPPVVKDDLLFLAGGSGVTPFRGFVRSLRARLHERPVTLVTSARVPADLVFDAEMRRHARETTWFRYVPTVTRLDPSVPFAGRRGRVDAAMLRSLLRRPAETTVYACGPDPFVDAALAAAAEAGVPAAKTHKEKWG